MKVEFQGIKKTKKGILERLMATSDTLDTLKDKLKSLKIFSYVESNNNKLKVVEDKNRINVSSSSVSGEMKNSLNIHLPNLFGRAINSKVSLSSLTDYKIELSKPVLTKRLFFLNFFNENHIVRLPCGNFSMNKSEVELKVSPVSMAVGLEKAPDNPRKYARINYESKGVNLGIKQDISPNPFTKFELAVKPTLDLFKGLKLETRFGLGSIFGNPPQYDKFYLGKNVKGYKDKFISPTDYNVKNGGLSYLEVTTKLLFSMNKLNLYAFNSFGYNSRQRNLTKTLNEIQKEIYNKDNSAFGHSIGLGVSVPVNKETGSLLDATLSFPLTNNSNIEKYQFDLNFDF
uniref:Bacterial surface antigen (D15) domain-containing protein n=1 Tax=Nosema bombycis TaxID=27978 RepID=A5JEK6_NOSBO|nr:unknown [Nosema bombycis]